MAAVDLEVFLLSCVCRTVTVSDCSQNNRTKRQKKKRQKAAKPAPSCASADLPLWRSHEGLMIYMLCGAQWARNAHVDANGIC